MTKEEISTVVNAGSLAEAKSLVEAALSADPSDDTAYYALGRALWKHGRRGEAMEAYSRATAINPRSEAAHALTIARDVFDYFNPDLLNP